MPVFELVFPGRLLPFSLLKRFNARPTTRSTRHAIPPYSECRADPSHRLHFCPLHTYRLSAPSWQTMQKGPSCPLAHSASPCVALPRHCVDGSGHCMTSREDWSSRYHLFRIKASSRIWPDELDADVQIIPFGHFPHSMTL